jgi:hypothetical protein
MLTVGVLAKRFNVPIHRIEYVIRAYRVVPVARAGSAHVFSEDDATYIGSILRRIAAERGEDSNAN